MTTLVAALLGVVQGITEFLPVSSSAHLLLAREVLGWDAGGFGLAFDVACHVGTLLAVGFYFRVDVVAMLRALPRAAASSPNAAGRQVRLIVIGTLPVVVGGLAWGEWIARAARTPAVTVATLAVGALAFLVVERRRASPRDAGALRWPAALVIGAAQALALVPGVSRSGATIVAGMWLGLSRPAAARFGFLLGMPAIAAAAGRTAVGLDPGAFGPDVWRWFLTGVVVSGIVGYLVVALFLRYLAKHPLDVFAYYRLALAGAVLVWVLTP